MNAPQLLNFMADAYGGEIFLVSDNAPKGAVLLGTDETDVFAEIGHLGLQQKEQGNRYFSLNSKTVQDMC